MCTDNVSDLYNRLIRQVETIIDLDRPEVELLKVDRSKYGVTNYPNCHVHDVLTLNIRGKLFYAKSEDVYLRLSSPHALNYTTFYAFSLSLFQLDDSSVPERIFRFPDDPDIAAVKFERALLRQQRSLIESITDGTSPGDIPDPKVRQLFIFYLSRKERLVSDDGTLYDDVFNHHGRDLIHEVLASVVGQLLNIPVPRSFFGHSSSNIRLASSNTPQCLGPENHRYVVSEAIPGEHPSPLLLDVLNRRFKEHNIIWGLSLYRNESNPLNLSSFQNENAPDPNSVGHLIIASCANYADLIRSDFLDHLLGGSRDRKPFDYFLPKGLQGPIYTLDFGEILFPELVFAPSDPHYLREREAQAHLLTDYFQRVKELSRNSPYRRVIADLVTKIKEIDGAFFSRLISAIPETFLFETSASTQYSYQTATLIDFLQQQFKVVAAQQHL